MSTNSTNVTVELVLSIPSKIKHVKGDVGRNVTLGTIEFVIYDNVRHGSVRVKHFDFVTNTTHELAGMQSGDSVGLYEFTMSYCGVDAVWYYFIDDVRISNGPSCLTVKCSLLSGELWQLLLSLRGDGKLPTFMQFPVKCEPCVR